MSGILAIAVTEIRIGTRNSWVLLAWLILAAFAILLVLAGAVPAGEVKASVLEVAAASLATLSVYLVPLIALLLSFDAIAGEIDRGTLQLVLATPVSRGQVLAGKLAGHLCVLSIAIVAGYGLAGGLGMVISGAFDPAGFVAFARLIATSILLGAAFLAIGYIVSAGVSQTGTAAALAVAIWLFAVVFFDLALLGGLLASGDGFFTQNVFPWLLVVNPADAFRVYNMSAVDRSLAGTGLGAGSAGLPVTGLAVLLGPTAWIVAAMALATFVFDRVKP